MGDGSLVGRSVGDQIGVAVQGVVIPGQFGERGDVTRRDLAEPARELQRDLDVLEVDTLSVHVRAERSNG